MIFFGEASLVRIGSPPYRLPWPALNSVRQSLSQHTLRLGFRRAPPEMGADLFRISVFSADRDQICVPHLKKLRYFNVEILHDSAYYMDMQLKPKTRRGGRPPKFREPRQPVTMTLPKRILELLAEIDPDRTRAVVKVTEAVAGMGREHAMPVELVKMAPGKSLIVVGPCKVLKHIPWLKLIEITPARYLITISSGTPIEALEVGLRDLLNSPELQKNDRELGVLQELLNLIGQQRRTRRLSKAEILIIDTSKAADF